MDTVIITLMSLIFYQIEGVAYDDFGVNEPDFIFVENGRKYYNFKTEHRNDFDFSVDRVMDLMSILSQGCNIKPVLCAVKINAYSLAFTQVTWKISTI